MLFSVSDEHIRSFKEHGEWKGASDGSNPFVMSIGLLFFTKKATFQTFLDKDTLAEEAKWLKELLFHVTEPWSNCCADWTGQYWLHGEYATKPNILELVWP